VILGIQTDSVQTIHLFLLSLYNQGLILKHKTSCKISAKTKLPSELSEWLVIKYTFSHTATTGNNGYIIRKPNLNKLPQSPLSTPLFSSS
jgi:hypothetical protein